MIVYNTNLMDITLPSIKGHVTFKGAWNRNQDKHETAFAGKYGTTEIAESRWLELQEEFKDTSMIKKGQLFVAKNKSEAETKLEDVEPATNKRLAEKDVLKGKIKRLG